MARDHRRRVARLDLAAAGLAPDAWLAIVGAKALTRVQMQVGRDGRGKPRFSISDEDVVDEWASDDPSWNTGDGTVPLRGAVAPFLDANRLVVVTPEDFGFWELKDRVVFGVTGCHALLPNLNLAQRLALKHLRPEFRGDVWGRPVPGIVRRQWKPPIPHLPHEP